jgi:cyanophycinase-like exopeptidase
VLITCNECGKEYSDQSKTCIHCGAKNRPSAGSRGKTALFVFLGLGVAVLIMIAGNSNSPESAAANKAAIAADFCAQSAEAAHYIAAMSIGSSDVSRVTGEAIAERKYPILGDKVVASIAAIVITTRSTQSPDEISATVLAQCQRNAR